MNATTPALTMAARLSTSVTEVLAGRRLSILVFHRVLAKPDPLFPEEVDAQRFENMMRVVGRAFAVLTLGQAVRRLREGTLPSRAMVITFDDGYADNADVALPIMLRHGVAGTFFVATGFLDGGRMWNDTIIETIRRCRLPTIDLSEFGLGARELGNAHSRRACINALIPVVKYQDLSRRLLSLQRLAQLAGHPDLPADLMMTSAKVQHMHRQGMEIGGHTMTHPILSTLADDAARAEIQGGQQQLQSLIDAPVDVFAYPNGRPGQDYDQRHVDIVASLGFRGAVTTDCGAAGIDADPFQLPRFTPWDTNMAKWSARLIVSRTNKDYRRAAVPA